MDSEVAAILAEREQKLLRLADSAIEEIARQESYCQSRFDEGLGLVTVGPELDLALSLRFGGDTYREIWGIPVLKDPTLGDEFAVWHKARQAIAAP